MGSQGKCHSLGTLDYILVMCCSHQVAAVVVPREGKDIILSELREWAKDHMASYAVPTLLRCVDRLPKNSMGKVNKKEIITTLFPESSQQSQAP
jgi:non-ribosomal peptide synthetase component E (peptide arylation enzyme)